jgi:haloalkane dehalogenase
MEVYRTPDERFEGLPDFDFEPRYRQVDEVRLAHVEVGAGPPVVMLHGEPSWSFIYRKLFGPISDAGFRCIAPDFAGFGRSDKPVDPAWYGVERYVAHTSGLLEELDLRDITLVVHDWGGPVGAAVALQQRDRIARMVILDTTLDSKDVWMNETWVRFHDYVAATEDLPIGEIMRTTCAQALPQDVIAAYNAPFPGPESQGGAHGLPLATPRARETAPETLRLYEALHDDPLPVLMLWGEQDVVLPLAVGQRLAHAIGRRIDHVISGAGHAIQEDQGELVGSLIADWLGSESG